MKYLYYPGCSLEGTALEYNLSTRAFMEAVGAELEEIEDWTCCGASAAEPVSYLLSLALPARNLALAEKRGDIEDILVPCSACYLNLKRVEQKIREDPALHEKLNIILNEDHIHLKGQKKVRHLLDVMAVDLGPETIRPLLKKKLSNFTVAPYYGCQCLRPYAVFDDPERPTSMEPLIETVGAGIHHWEMGGRCCGASHMNTKMEVAFELVASILRSAKGADAILTVCPMCQVNLEAYQQKISKRYQEDLSITILYLPQFLGMALGLSAQDLRLDLNLSVTNGFRKKMDRAV